MAMEVRRSGREGAAAVVEALREWAPAVGYLSSIHAGDVGWHLRFDDDALAGALVTVLDGGEPVAVGLLEESWFRPTINPDRIHDGEVAAALASVLPELPADATAFTDASSESAYRALLSGQGWQLDPDPWIYFYRPLTAADGEPHDPLCASLGSDRDIADRVQVQRAAFPRSTFTVKRWHQMAAGPGYDPELELLRRDADGAPVAAATGWSAGPGKMGILEPVGGDPAYAGHGHGMAISRAVIAALARAGANGVTVITPASNVGAVRSYERCGLRPVEHLHALIRPATSPQ